LIVVLAPPWFEESISSPLSFFPGLFLKMSLHNPPMTAPYLRLDPPYPGFSFLVFFSPPTRLAVFVHPRTGNCSLLLPCFLNILSSSFFLDGVFFIFQIGLAHLARRFVSAHFEYALPPFLCSPFSSFALMSPSLFPVWSSCPLLRGFWQFPSLTRGLWFHIDPSYPMSRFWWARGGLTPYFFFCLLGVVSRYLMETLLPGLFVC